MMNRYNELISIIQTKLNEEIYCKHKDKNKFCIYGLDTRGDDERFTQIEFRIEDKSLVIPWLYLSKSNTGCGSEIIKWFYNICKEQGIEKIEIRLVSNKNFEMIRFLKKFDYEIKNTNEDFINFIKVVR